MANSSNLPFPAELCAHFLSYLAVRDICSWGWTCKYAQDIVPHVLLDRYRAEVAPFVQPDAFALILKENRAVISGSVALHFLEGRPDWSPHDMDVYVPHHAFHTVVQYLVDHEGYTQSMPVPRPQQIIAPANVAHQETDDVGDVDAAGIGNLHNGVPAIVGNSVGGQETGNNGRVNSDEEEGYGRLAGAIQIAYLERNDVEIDVICSLTDGAIHPIGFFWGSAVMNYLDGYRIACAYPRLTLNRRCLVTPLARIRGIAATPSVVRCINKYHARGFDIAMSRHALTRKQAALTAVGAIRSFEDSSSLVLHFANAHSPPDRLDDEWKDQWQLGGRLGEWDYTGDGWTVARISNKVQIPYHS